LRVPPPSPYVYRSVWKRAAAGALDRAGGLLLAKPPSAVDWPAVERVAVLRLDHLGDLIHALPALRRLRRALPKARLDLWVGPWGQGLAELFRDVDAVHVSAASWFRRPRRRDWPWSDILALASGLRAQAYGAAFDLRGELRHHLALYGSGIPVRAGQALTAGRFLLTHAALWKPGLHEQEQSLSLLDQAGVPAAGQGREPYLSIPAAARREADALCRSQRLGAAPVLVQAASGTRAKRWPQESWVRVLAGLPQGLPLALLGTREEASEMRAIAAAARRPVAVLAGRLSLASLAALLGRARLLLSVDSGPAHLAAVQGTPVLALYSGTNEAAQWAPRGARVRVLRAGGIPCAPCELADCPFDNACMRALDAGLVLAQARRLLKAGPAAKGPE
jgi:ADP-heptose:LPS heptosyltransferase